MIPAFRLDIISPEGTTHTINALPDSLFLTQNIEGHIILSDKLPHLVRNLRQPEVQHYNCDKSNLPIAKMGDITMSFPDGTTITHKAYLRPLEPGQDALFSLRCLWNIAHSIGDRSGFFGTGDGRALIIAGVSFPFISTAGLPPGHAISNHMTNTPEDTDDEYYDLSVGAYDLSVGAYVNMISTRQGGPKLADFTTGTALPPPSARRNPPTAWPLSHADPPLSSKTQVIAVSPAEFDTPIEFDFPDEGPHESIEIDIESGKIEPVVNTSP